VRLSHVNVDLVADTDYLLYRCSLYLAQSYNHSP